MKKLAFIASGNGSNFENVVREIQAGTVPAEAVVLLCDKPGAKCLERAARLGVTAEVVDRKQFADRAAFEARLAELVDLYQADYIVLAGFMRILSADFVHRYEKRLINIHPSYLPAFPGAHAIRDAFEAKVKETGVTVHFVIAEVDAGPVILQEKLPIRPDDTLESLETRVHDLEYKLYPAALRQLLS